MSDYDVVIGILAFLIISHLVLVEFQAGEHFFQDVNITDDQLAFSPDDPTPEFQRVDLDGEAVIAQENVTLVDTDTLNNTDYPEEGSAYVLIPGADTGYVDFRLPEARAIEIKTQKVAFFKATRTDVQFEGDNETIPIEGVSNFNLEPNQDQMRIIFRENFGLLDLRDPRLYSVDASETQDNQGFLAGIPLIGGLLQGFIDTLYSLISTPIRFWEVFQQFPFYFQVFYGGLVAWMIADILQIG